MRAFPRLIAIVAVFSLALFAVRSYSQNMNATPDHSHPRLDPASWPDTSLTIANLGHATVLMNFFGTRELSHPSLFSLVCMSFDSILTIGPKRFVYPPLAPTPSHQLALILITHTPLHLLHIPS